MAVDILLPPGVKSKVPGWQKALRLFVAWGGHKGVG